MLNPVGRVQGVSARHTKAVVLIEAQESFVGIIYGPPDDAHHERAAFLNRVGFRTGSSSPDALVIVRQPS